MAKQYWKPATLLSPLPPALISCGTIEKPNVMTVAWTGIISSEPPMTYVSIRPSRYSHTLIEQTKDFVINLPTLDLADITDWCGVKSGKEVDKFSQTGLIASKSKCVCAPSIEQSPLSLECRVINKLPLGSHDMFIAEIVSVSVDEKYIDNQGRLNLEKAGILAYMHGFYYTLGRKLGKFGYSVEKGKKTPIYGKQSKTFK